MGKSSRSKFSISFLIALALSLPITIPMGLGTKIVNAEIQIAIDRQIREQIGAQIREQFGDRKNFLDKFFGDRERRGGSRSPFCSIVPSPSLGSILWNNMPLLVWKTKNGVAVKKVAIIHFETEETIWSEDNLNPTQQFFAYTGMPLASGEYQYKVVYEFNNKEFMAEIDFDIMVESDRDRIARELQQRESQNTNLNLEERALQRADVFADRKLWVDGLQELFALPTPSPTLREELQKLRNSLCHE